MFIICSFLYKVSLSVFRINERMLISEFMLGAMPMMMNTTMVPLRCDRDTTSGILVSAMFSFEIDTLEMALHNYCGFADVLLVEGIEFHNVAHRKKDRKPVLWPLIKRHPRFAALSRVVKHHLTCPASNSDDMWGAEDSMNRCISKTIKSKFASHYNTIVVGSVDEILSRQSLLALSLKPVRYPTSATSGFFMSQATTLFRSDWPNRNAFSFALPSIYPNTSESFVRQFKRYSSEKVYSGAHLTNYCFWPNQVYKVATASSYTPKLFDICDSYAVNPEKCYNFHVERTRPINERDLHAVLPPALDPDRYPAWYKKTDPRELDLKAQFQGHCKK